MILRNPKYHGAPIREFETGNGRFSLDCGEVADFDEVDGKILLKTYPFLEHLDEHGTVINAVEKEPVGPKIVDDMVIIGDKVYKLVNAERDVVPPAEPMPSEEPVLANKSVTDDILEDANFESEEDKPSKKKDQSSPPRKRFQKKIPKK